MTKNEIANNLIENSERMMNNHTSETIKKAWHKRLMNCTKAELELKLQYQTEYQYRK